jgi:hypothetical protein
VARASISVVANIAELVGNFYGASHFKEFTKSAGSRWRALLRWVQIALKPASKTLGFHGVFIRGEGLKYVIADSSNVCQSMPARAGSILASIIGALHIGQAGRSIATNGMTDDRR